MKTIFLKKMMPFAIVLVTATSGAFLTTSMQTAKSKIIKTGYVTDENNVPCNSPVQCSTIQDEFCRVSYDPQGEQALGKTGNCTETLYRPKN